MTDIVATLRQLSYVSPPRKVQDYSSMVGKDVLAAAADEIESLREFLSVYERYTNSDIKHQIEVAWKTKKETGKFPFED